MAVAKKTTTLSVKPTATAESEPTDTVTTVEPSVVTPAEPVVAGPVLKKADLVDRVVLRSGIKKKYAKPVVEAALAVLGEALTNGEEFNLQPFGKMKINNQKEVANALVYNVRVRRQKSDAEGTTVADDLAEAAAGEE